MVLPTDTRFLPSPSKRQDFPQKKENQYNYEGSRSGQKRILAAFDVMASLVHARSNAGNSGVIPGDGGKCQPCVGKARRGGAGFGEPSQRAPRVSEKLLRVHSEKGVLRRVRGLREQAIPNERARPFRKGPRPRRWGQRLRRLVQLHPGRDQASDNTVEHVEQCGQVTHGWLEHWA